MRDDKIEIGDGLNIPKRQAHTKKTRDLYISERTHVSYDEENKNNIYKVVEM